MSVVMTLKNGLEIFAECDFRQIRYTRAAAALNVETPCEACMIPYEGCETVDKLRLYVWDETVNATNWEFDSIDPADQLILESALVNTNLTFDTIAAGCHWTGSQSNTGSGVTIDVDIDITVTDDASNPGRVSFSLDVQIAISGDLSDTKTITYTASNVDPWDDDPVTGVILLTTTASSPARTMSLGPDDEEMQFPTSFTVSVGGV